MRMTELKNRIRFVTLLWATGMLLAGIGTVKAQSSFTIQLSEVGSDVVATGSGDDRYRSAYFR